VHISFTSNINKAGSLIIAVKEAEDSIIAKMLSIAYGFDSNPGMLEYCHPPMSGRCKVGSTFKNQFMTENDVWFSLDGSQPLNLEVHIVCHVNLTIIVDGQSMESRKVEIDESIKKLGLDTSGYKTAVSWEVDGQRTELQDITLVMNKTIIQTIKDIDTNVDLIKVREFRIDLYK
ncbi:hypothetical protein GGH94_001919, partial [Coemansia aciculifera]